MVVIRLARHGAKKRPFYHIVAADKKRGLGGRYIERIGYFNPMATGGDIRIHMDKLRVDHWLSVGAQASERVTKLIKDFNKGLTGPKPAKPKAQKAKPAEKPETKQAASAKASEEEAKDNNAEQIAEKPEDA